jgi:hypothetical protein
VKPAQASLLLEVLVTASAHDVLEVVGLVWVRPPVVVWSVVDLAEFNRKWLNSADRDIGSKNTVISSTIVPKRPWLRAKWTSFDEKVEQLW